MCHQTVSLAARHLEESGIPTVTFGCARDIVESCGVPRFVFSDFPLGNPPGRPCDLDMQRAVLQMGLDLLVSAQGPAEDAILKSARKATGEQDAMVIAFGAIKGQDCVVVVQDFAFMGGSLGMAAGDRKANTTSKSPRSRDA